LCGGPKASQGSSDFSGADDAKSIFQGMLCLLLLRSKRATVTSACLAEPSWKMIGVDKIHVAR